MICSRGPSGEERRWVGTRRGWTEGKERTKDVGCALKRRPEEERQLGPTMYSLQVLYRTVPYLLGRFSFAYGGISMPWCPVPEWFFWSMLQRRGRYKRRPAVRRTPSGMGWAGTASTASPPSWTQPSRATWDPPPKISRTCGQPAPEKDASLHKVTGRGSSMHQGGLYLSDLLCGGVRRPRSLWRSSGHVRTSTYYPSVNERGGCINNTRLITRQFCINSSRARRSTLTEHERAGASSCRETDLLSCRRPTPTPTPTSLVGCAWMKERRGRYVCMIQYAPQRWARCSDGHRMRAACWLAV